MLDGMSVDSIQGSSWRSLSKIFTQESESTVSPARTNFFILIMLVRTRMVLFIVLWYVRSSMRVRKACHNANNAVSSEWNALIVRYRKHGPAWPWAVHLGGAVQSHAYGDDLLEDLSGSDRSSARCKLDVQVYGTQSWVDWRVADGWRPAQKCRVCCSINQSMRICICNWEVVIAVVKPIDSHVP